MQRLNAHLEASERKMESSCRRQKLVSFASHGKEDIPTRPFGRLWERQQRKVVLLMEHSSFDLLRRHCGDSTAPQKRNDIVRLVYDSMAKGEHGIFNGVSRYTHGI